MKIVLALVVLAATHAVAEPLENTPVMPREQLRPQLQVDGGLSIIGVGYEHPVGAHVALQVEAGVFGSYFLPWFDLGDRVVGGVGGVRATWFADQDGRGVYVTPYVRAGYASGEHDGMDGSGPVITAGAFVGWAFRLTKRLDLRAGLGGQYIYIGGDDGFGASTPFAAIDFTVGYRL
jgi:hypothetical protein